MNLKKYLKEKQNIIFLTSGNIAVFGLILLLYRIPLKVVIYPGVLSMVIMFIHLIWDFDRKKQKVKNLKNVIAGVTDVLPNPDSQTEQIYQDYMEELKDEHDHFMDLQDKRYKDMVDYYTTWAHQIKTPIAAMHLKLQNEDSSISRQLSTDLLRIEQYVDMVMVYLRLESTSSDYVLRKCSIDGVVRKALSTFATEFISRKVSLSLEPLTGTFVTDEKWFCFVLEQLLSNALKYTRLGTISISMKEDKLYISDTGIGIAPEDIPRIFQKGYTGFNGRKDRHASGLGLYLCKQICDRLNIPISVESKINEGTTFSLELSQYDLKTE